MGIEICSDLKPMFRKECEFLERETGVLLPGRGWQQGLWLRYKTIWFNGRRMMRMSASGKPRVIKEYSPIDTMKKSAGSISPEVLYRANKSTIDQREQEAISFVRDITGSHARRRAVVSFSGGKDSLVVSYIVRKALGNDRVLHMFGNTTIEYPDTLQYISHFQRDNQNVPFCESSSKHDFLHMCGLLGPPSRLFAWCCSVFKSAPIASMVGEIKGEHGIISFEGIRKRESARRSNRGNVYMNKKIVHQLSAYPILDWKEVEVWLFILAKGLEFNQAYEKGFSRVGCMYCPNNIAYNEYLVKTYYEEQSKEWNQFLIKYAKESGKPQPLDYVESGAWKKRVGEGQGKSSAYIKKTPCLKNVNAMHFILERAIMGDFVDRFKPFGRIEQFGDSVGEGFIAKDPNTCEPKFMVKRVNDINILRNESRVDMTGTVY
jgi:phosphoadenosine phosphosulfate reductase